MEEYRMKTKQEYSEILAKFPELSNGKKETIHYDFSCPEYKDLAEKYGLFEVAGEGTDLERAVRILHFLSPGLAHASDYDNHVPMNALDLMAYSFHNPEHGINCLNKAKIMVEACLALGIYARRISIFPYDSHDPDNHVVTEVYDRALGKWAMLDPTIDAGFVGNDGKYLSMLEIRTLFASGGDIRFHSDVLKVSAEEQADFEEEVDSLLAYFAKNSFSFMITQHQRFGLYDDDPRLDFFPAGFSMKKHDLESMKFKVEAFGRDSPAWARETLGRIKELEGGPEIEPTDVSVLTDVPF